MALLFVAVAGFALAPASAATWTKFDSGKIKLNKDVPGFKNYIIYASYSKGSNKILMQNYLINKKSGKSLKYADVQLTKPNKNYLKVSGNNIYGEKLNETSKWPYSTKTAYKYLIYSLKIQR